MTANQGRWQWVSNTYEKLTPARQLGLGYQIADLVPRRRSNGFIEQWNAAAIPDLLDPKAKPALV